MLDNDTKLYAGHVVDLDLPSMRGGTPGGGVASFKADQRAQRESRNLYGTRTYVAVPMSPKFGLADQGHHNVVEDLGPLLPEDRNLLEDAQRKYNLNETELRQLRDEYVAYGYDDFPGRSARGFEEIDIPDDLPPGGGGRIDKFRQEVADLPDSRFKDVLLEDIDEVMGLPDDFFDQPGVGTREESLSNIMELYEMQKRQGFPAIKSPVADADIPAPSFEDLQRKIGDREAGGPRFGDPNELEMLKEAYRRAAISKQEGDIARNRIRGTRSPGAQGAPDSFPGDTPEGTARAERRSPLRERPGSKKK